MTLSGLAEFSHLGGTMILPMRQREVFKMDPFSRRRPSDAALEHERHLEPDAEGGDLAVLDVDRGDLFACECHQGGKPSSDGPERKFVLTSRQRPGPFCNVG